MRFGSKMGALHRISVTVGSPCVEASACSKTLVASPLRPSRICSPGVPFIAVGCSKLAALNPLLSTEEIMERALHEFPSRLPLSQDATELRCFHEHLSRIDSVDTHSVQLRADNLHCACAWDIR